MVCLSFGGQEWSRGFNRSFDKLTQCGEVREGLFDQLNEHARHILLHFVSCSKRCLQNPVWNNCRAHLTQKAQSNHLRVSNDTLLSDGNIDVNITSPFSGCRQSKQRPAFSLHRKYYSTNYECIRTKVRDRLISVEESGDLLSSADGGMFAEFSRV